jgi:hypothetical protein
MDDRIVELPTLARLQQLAHSWLGMSGTSIQGRKQDVLFLIPQFVIPYQSERERLWRPSSDIGNFDAVADQLGQQVNGSGLSIPVHRGEWGCTLSATPAPPVTAWARGINQTPSLKVKSLTFGFPSHALRITMQSMVCQHSAQSPGHRNAIAANSQLHHLTTNVRTNLRAKHWGCGH